MARQQTLAGATRTNNRHHFARLHVDSERHARRILAAFERDGFAGLEDQRTRVPNHSANQLTLPFLKHMLDVQKEHPRAGKFRVQGLLEKKNDGDAPSVATVGRAMAINRQLHGAPPPWSTDKQAEAEDDEIKTLPYRPRYRHHYWFIDIRYLVERDGKWVYSICILEGYARKLLAGMASEYQDGV